jgi:hypothetical protein
MTLKTHKLSLVGQRFRPAGEGILHAMLDEHPVLLLREPKNPHDHNAIAVYVQIGYVAAFQARSWAKEFDTQFETRAGHRAKLMNRRGIEMTTFVPDAEKLDIAAADVDPITPFVEKKDNDNGPVR